MSKYLHEVWTVRQFAYFCPETDKEFGTVTSNGDGKWIIETVTGQHFVRRTLEGAKYQLLAEYCDSF